MAGGSEQVLDVKSDAPGSTLGWIPVRAYDPDYNANSTDFATGKALNIYDAVQPGQTIQVTYTAPPTLLANDDDVFSDTGLPATCSDVVTYGAMWRLVAAAHAARIDFKSLSANQLDSPDPFGSAQKLSQYFYQLYSVRLAQEVSQFRVNNQPRLRWTR